MPTLYIMQGVPGSGKSTLARAIANGSMDKLHICSTDSFFVNADGFYQFDPSKLAEYHKRNQQDALSLLIKGYSVIIDNTNIKRIHVRPYVEMSLSLRVPVVFIRVDGPFQSTHGVPEAAIERMRREMEDLTIESVMAATS